jgi:hypothetical protein
MQTVMGEAERTFEFRAYRNPALKGYGVKEWLIRLLAGGPKFTEDVRIEARKVGITWYALQRARQDIGCRVMNLTGESHSWTWSLPRARDLFDPD